MDVAKSSSSRNSLEVPDQQAEPVSCQDDIQIVFERRATSELRSFLVEESVPHGISTTGGDQSRPYQAAGHGQSSPVSTGSSQFPTSVVEGRGHGRTADGSFPSPSSLNGEAALTALKTEMLWHETLDVLNEMFAVGDIDQSWAPTLQKCYEEKWQSHSPCPPSARKESKTRR